MRELVIDNFAGGGGASLGITRAIGREVDYAINHNAEAIAMHAANHPGTVHLTEDVWKVNPAELCAGRPVGMVWLSPDCTHFSKAKGGKPRSKKIRGLAWVAVRWAQLPVEIRPRVLLLENVEEFETWGPLVDGRPCPKRAGQTFRKWKRRLERLGYKVEKRVLVAADYGAPTTRKRLFIVARCDGQKITWPEPTHAKDPGASLHAMHLKKWRSAAECIDWSLPCPSIFERSKPLAENTQRRIAEGIRRYVLNCAEPFIVEYPGHSTAPCIVKPNHAYEAFRGQSVERPLPTQTKENQFALSVPVLVGIDNKSSGDGATWAGGEPLRTVTMENRFALAAPHLVEVGYGEVRAFLTTYYGQGVGQEVKDPMRTVVSKDRMGLVYVRGVLHQIVDIGLRMLQPRELARAQGFPDWYKLPGTKSSQVARIGNSVCPDLAEALVRVNYQERALAEVAA